MANITLQEMYDEWKKAANGIGTPSDSAQPDPTQAATIIAALKGQLERLGDLLEQMQGNGTGAMPVQLTGSYIRQDLSTIFGTIPAGTAKAVVVDVPKEATMFVLGLRITGRVNRVRKSGSIGGFIFHESTYVELTSNDVEQVLSNISNVTNLLTKKIPVYSEKLAIELRASADGDVSANTGSNSGIIIYWWRD